MTALAPNRRAANNAASTIRRSNSGLVWGSSPHIAGSTGYIDAFAPLIRAITRCAIVATAGDQEPQVTERNGTPGVIRTPDPLLRRQVLYPAELRAHIAVRPAPGVEPSTHIYLIVHRGRPPVNATP